jgi:PRTRC genetic system protein C
VDIQNLTREFNYNGVKLADPSTAFTLIQVRDFYSNVYPEIVSADIEGPKNIGARAIYTFRRAVGTKGLTMLDLFGELEQAVASGQVSAPDCEYIDFFQRKAAANETLSTCQGMLLVELHRRYFPAAAA